MARKIIVFALLVSMVLFVGACQRNKYPLGNTKSPADAPKYTVEADKNS